MPRKRKQNNKGPNGHWGGAFIEAYRDALYNVMIEDIEEALKDPNVRQKIKEFNQALLAFLQSRQSAR